MKIRWNLYVPAFLAVFGVMCIALGLAALHDGAVEFPTKRTHYLVSKVDSPFGFWLGVVAWLVGGAWLINAAWETFKNRDSSI